MRLVRIARILTAAARRRHDRGEVAAAPAEQGPADLNAARSAPTAADAGETGEPGAADQAHRQGLRLVVGMVTGENASSPSSATQPASAA